LDPTFGSFTLLELVSLMKVFRLFRLEWIVLGVQSVDTLGRCTTSYLLAGPVCLWCLVLEHMSVCIWMEGRKDSTKLQYRSDQSPMLADIDDPRGYIYFFTKPTSFVQSPLLIRSCHPRTSGLQNTSCSQIVWHYNHKLIQHMNDYGGVRSKEYEIDQSNYIHWVTSYYGKFGTNQFPKRASWNAYEQFTKNSKRIQPLFKTQDNFGSYWRTLALLKCNYYCWNSEIFKLGLPESPSFLS
jgi:hypothetical protein